MAELPLGQAPAALCLVRLSALGDVINLVPVVHTIQRHWPDTALTWVIGRAERELVAGLAGVRFVEFDKRAGYQGYRALRRSVTGERFEALLQMQLSLRANLAGRMVPAGLRLGYDRARSREGHGLFVNRRIRPPAGRHVLDTYFAFLDALGLDGRVMDWSVPIPPAERQAAAARLGDAGRVLLISACSSHPLRNWRAERYAAVADHAARRHDYRVVLLGGPGETERRMAQAVTAAMRAPALDLVGRTSLKGLLALAERGDVLISPDSGPAHIANAVGTDVIALHAATESARGGPYNSLHWCVDRYDEAARRFCGRPATQLRWGEKIERPGVMDLITVDDVIERFEAWHAQHRRDAHGEPWVPGTAG